MKHKMNVKQAIPFAAVSILCAVPIVMGIVCLFNGWIINIPFVISFFAMPIAVMAIAYPAIASSGNIWTKVLVCAVMVWISSSLFLFLMNNCAFERLVSTKGEKAASSYQSADLTCEIMPSVGELGEYIGLEYHDYRGWENVHAWHSDTLIAAYSESEYAQQKLLLKENYDFLDTLLMSYDGNTYSASCRIRDYAFRVVNTGTATGNPHSIVFIAFNDRTQEIVYLSFYHCCSAEISTLDLFLKEDCGWEHIR